MPITITTSGYIEVWREGVFVSRHTVETKAVESAIAHAEENGEGDYEIRFPNKVLMSRIRRIVMPFRWNTVTAVFTQGTAGSVNLSAFLDNPQGRGIIYTVIGTLPTGVTLSGSTLTYNGTSPASLASVQFRATSGSYAAESSPVAVTIQVVTVTNRAPTWATTVGPFTVPSTGGTVALSSFASDLDGDPLTFGRTGGVLDTAPGGVSVNSAGVMTVSSGITAGAYSVEVYADDGTIGFAPEAGYTVSGDISDGGALTITGSGFGVGPTQVRFSGGPTGIIETLSAGQTRTSIAPWYNQFALNAAGLQCAIDAARGKVLHNPGTGLDWSSALTVDTADMQEGTYVYTSYWMRRDTVFDAFGVGEYNTPAQNKMTRLADRQDIFNPALLDETYFYDRRQTPWSSAGNVGVPHTRNGETIPNYYFNDNAFGSQTTLGWKRIELEYFIGTRGGADGSLKLRVTESGSVPIEATITGKTWYAAATTNCWRVAYWQNYFGNGYDGPACKVWHDDHYVSVGARSRIEITNSATRGSETQSEIQHLQTWADGSVSTLINIGALASLSGKYLWAVKNDGSAVRIGQFT